MSLIILNVDEVRRTLSASGGAFVVHDKEVDIVRFAINSGFADIVLDGQAALRVMYQRPGETEVRAQTLTYYDTDGLRNYYDWQLLSADLAEKGTLTVALCILRVDSEVEEWHTTPCQVRVLGSIHTDDSDEGDETITPTVAERVAVLEASTQRLYSMAGGAPVVVPSVSEMVDEDKIYVLTTDKKWYYYDGSAWIAGGEYGAVSTDTTLTQSGVPADAKAVGDAIAAGSGESFYINNPHNLLDWTAEGVLEGKIWYTTNASTTNGNGNISDFMEVEPGETICVNYCAKLKWFSAEKAFLANAGVSDTYYITVTAPEGAAYFRIQASNEHKDGAWVYKYYGEYYDFSVYADHVTTPVVTDNSAAVAITTSVNSGLENGDVDMSKVQDDVLSYDMIDQMEAFRWQVVDNSKNLAGWSINENTGEVRYSGIGTSTEFVTTDFCKVKPGEAYTGYNGYLYGYDADKTYVGKLTSTGAYAWTIPDGVYYVRLCQLVAVNAEHKYNFNLLKNGYGHTFGYMESYPYERAFPIFKSDDEKIAFKLYLDTEPWRDKKILVIGDSFSAPGVWQNDMCNNFYATLVSSSISGAGWTTGRTKTVYQLAQEVTVDPDIIIITLGANDLGVSTLAGEFYNGTSVEDYSTDTWWGAMQKALTYIRNRWTGVPVYIGFTPGAGSWGSVRNQRISDFIEVMKEVCILYSCVYIETRTCGMAYPLVQNDLIFRQAVGDGHPSTEGQHQIGRYMTDLMSGYIHARSWDLPTVEEVSET